MDNQNKIRRMKLSGETVPSQLFFVIAALVLFSLIKNITASENVLTLDTLRDIFVILITLALGVYLLKKETVQENHQSDYMRQISDEEFELVKSQLTEDRFYYKTFYLTDTCIYVPKDEILLPYNKLIKVQCNYHRKNKERFFLTLVDKRGMDYSFDIIQLHKFSKEKQTVVMKIQGLINEANKNERND